MQIRGVAKEGDRGRGRRIWTVRINSLNVIDLEGTEEREGSGIQVRKLPNVRPDVSTVETKRPDLLDVGRKQRHDAKGSVGTGNYIQRAPSRALEESLHVDLALCEVHLGP